jgi:hypothetical protein
MTNHIHLLFKSGKDGISAVRDNFGDVVSILAFL